MYSGSMITLYVTLALSGTMVSSIAVEEFFPQIRKNLTKVTWAHAVNNASYLEEVLLENDIMMIEADIVLGTTPESDLIVPIMAHPPVTVSDLTLQEFMSNITAHNTEVQRTNNGTRKGVKLDFKSIEAFSDAVNIFKSYADEGNLPLWINADILPGPINSTVEPVNATEFFDKTKEINNILYSIGWTTAYGNNSEGTYEKTQIEEMIETITSNNVKKPITFPVRAGLAAESLELMKDLLQQVNGSTLTIWSSEGDNVNATHLNALINTIGVEKIYIDVPEDLMDEIVIDPPKPPQPSGAISFVNSAKIALVLMFALLMRLF